MRVALLLLSSLLIAASPLVIASPFFGNHQEGWFWYQDSAKGIKEKPSGEPSPPSIPNPTEAMLALRKEVEDSLNLAILYPTESNLKAYAKRYFAVLKRGQHFTDAYKLMLLNYPQYDYALNFPTNHLVQPIHAEVEKKITHAKISRFAKSHGFFFFFSSRCPYCHAFAPIVKQLIEKYKLSLVPISLDGGALPEFSKVVQDNGSAKAFNVYSLPALFAVNPKNKEVIPIANGNLSLSELEENILRVVEAGNE